MNLALLAAALLIEAAAGYPQALYARIGHPVTWIGAAISWLELRLNRATWSFGQRKAAGAVALVLLLAAIAVPAYLIERALAGSWIGLAVIALLASTLLAARSLDSHVRAVATALATGGLTAGRPKPRARARPRARQPQPRHHRLQRRKRLAHHHARLRRTLILPDGSRTSRPVRAACRRRAIAGRTPSTNRAPSSRAKLPQSPNV